MLDMIENPADVREVLLDELRGEIGRTAEADGKPIAAVAREAGVAESTFHAWMKGSYAGNNEAIADKARRWLAARETRERTRTMMPAAPGFIETQSAKVFFALFEHAQHAPDMAVISGGPGVGKTKAASAYRDRAPNVWLLTADPSLNKAAAILALLGDAVQCGERATTKISKAVIRRVRGSGGLIIVDEAQHLRTEAIDQLRSIHDQAEIGLVLCGHEAMFGRIEGAGRKMEFAQLYSRIGMRAARRSPLRADIDALLDAWRIELAETRRALHAVARKPGALRMMTKVLRVAHAQAAGEAVGLRHVERAYAALTAERLIDDAREPA